MTSRIQSSYTLGDDEQAKEIARLQQVVASLQAELQQSRQRADICQQLHAEQCSDTSNQQLQQYVAQTILTDHRGTVGAHVRQHMQHAGSQRSAQAAVAGQVSPAAIASIPATHANGTSESTNSFSAASAGTPLQDQHSSTGSASTPPGTATNSFLQTVLTAGQHEQQQNDLMQRVLQPMQELHAQQQLHSLQHQLQDNLGGSCTPIMQLQRNPNVSCNPSMQLKNPSGPPVPSAQHELQDSDNVVLSRQEYELLLLKEAAMDAVQEGITIADCSQTDMPLIYINNGFCKMTGYSRDEVLGKNCRFLQGSSRSQESVELRAAINAGKACVVQLMNYRKNGDPFVNYLSITPILDAQGRLTHYVGIQSDITELVNHRKAELAARHAALQAAAATEAKSQFLARMSHEIRTPLNGMIAVGQLLAETSLSPAQWDLVNTIRCSGETLLTLITDILDFSRIEANKLVLTQSVFSLQTVVEAAMEIAGLRAAQKRLQVAYHISSGLPKLLYGDAQRLQQVLLNILNNAVKFTEAGEILLEIWAEAPSLPAQQQQQQQHDLSPPAAAAASAAVEHPATLDSPKASLVASAAVLSSPILRAASSSSSSASGPDNWPTRMVRFSVKDTGIGISEADLGKLFQSFSQVDASPTRSYDGSGLGLVISKRLAEAMGGQMWAESSGPGRGSTFSWSIAVKVPPPQSLRGAVNTPSKHRRSNVLVSATKKDRMASDSGGTVAMPDSDEASSVVSSDAGTWASEPQTLSLLSKPASSSHKPRSTAAAAAAMAAAAAAISISSKGTMHHHRRLASSSSSSLSSVTDSSNAGTTPLAAAVAAVQQQHAFAANHNLTTTAPAGEAAMPLLRGKRVLLVEKCNVVRSVLALALQSWGCLVCAVKSEAEALQRLIKNGTLHVNNGSIAALQAEAAAAAGEVGSRSSAAAAEDSSAAAAGTTSAAAAAARNADGVLQLMHAAEVDEEMFSCPGPYDCVLLDINHTRLLSALTLCEDREAARLVFMGWPGQGEFEAATPQFDMELELPGTPSVPPPAAAAYGSSGGDQADRPSFNSAAALTDASGNTEHLFCHTEIQQSPIGHVAVSSRGSESAAAAIDAAASSSSTVGHTVQMQLPTVLHLEDSWRPGDRQLGYVTVTRPIRQGRLKLALEEVLAMNLDGEASDSSSSNSSSTCSSPSSKVSHNMAAAIHQQQCIGLPDFADTEARNTDSNKEGGVFTAAAGSSSEQHQHQHQHQQHQGLGSYPLFGLSEESSGELLAAAATLATSSSRSTSALLPTQQQQQQKQRRLSHLLLRPAGAAKHRTGCGLEAVAGSSCTAALRVLLAEDNAINMKVATGILARCGIQHVCQAVNGQEALAAVAAAGGGDAFDVLLIDLHMPLMGGMEVVSHFKQRYPQSKSVLVAVTADAFEDTRDRCLEAGFDAWLAKPFRVEDLVKVICDSQQRLQQQQQHSRRGPVSSG